MKRCAQCHGKLGLGVRFRNLWNGRGWVHLRFCSAHCKGLYELERYEANAKHHWSTFLARGSPNLPLSSSSRMAGNQVTPVHASLEHRSSRTLPAS